MREVSHARVSLSRLVTLIALVAISGCTGDDGADRTAAPSPIRIDSEITVNASRAEAGEAATIDLPPPPSRDTLAGYLVEGDGSVLVELLEVTRAIAAVDAPDVAACTDVAAKLRRLGSPGDLTAAANAIEDEPTRDIAVNLVNEVGLTLAACDDVPDEHPAQLAFDWILWARRVNEVTQ